MSKKRKNSAKKGNTQRNQRKPVQPRRARNGARALWLCFGAVVALLIAGRLGLWIQDQLAVEAPEEPGIPALASSAASESELPEGMPFEELQDRRLIINVHEHIQALEYAPVYLDIMNELGIEKICLMGSSKFTLTLNEKYGFTEYDQNNEELLKICEAYPGRFDAYCTVNPLDGDKLEKFRACMARGATGLKLYSGHGYVTKDNRYMFHPVAMDDPGMLPLFAYCESEYIPVVMHVNPYKGKKGFCEEFIAVLSAYPDLKLICPHFMLSSIKSTRLEEFLDTFPNLYTDVSFGDYFMEAGLKRISKSPEKFRRLFHKYPDRIMYGTDLVLTVGRTKTRQWVREQFQAYLDMLTTEQYTTPAIKGVVLNGLDLPDYIVERVLRRNYLDFIAKRPRGTKITRAINWGRMNVTPTGRKPGQAFPPQPKK